MARTKRTRTTKALLYFFLEGKIHKSLYVSRAKDEVTLNKHKITIEDYILEGKIKYPQKVYPIGNPESDWYKFMYSESDIMDIHQFILESGYSKNMPSKNELRALLKHNTILYTKTTEGNFVPVWKAD